MYEGILKKLKTSPQKTLFVAGSPFDVECAKAMGMDVYWHNRIDLKHKSENKADYIEKSLYRLTDILK
jgi:FMN phosphatase YigB (HAD superfamily)